MESAFARQVIANAKLDKVKGRQLAIGNRQVAECLAMLYGRRFPCPDAQRLLETIDGLSAAQHGVAARLFQSEEPETRQCAGVRIRRQRRTRVA